jgi:hypothetical protein
VVIPLLGVHIAGDVPGGGGVLGNN